VSLVVLGDNEVHMCSNRFFASYRREEGWLEVSGMSARRRASMNTGDAEGSGWWCSYQEVQGVEARLVARWWRMMRSTTARIVRWSSSCRWFALVVVVLLKPTNNQGPNLVSKVREDKRR
jgi:hypothetical protein